jgi:hypothetical protein
MTMSKVTAAFADAMEICSGYVDAVQAFRFLGVLALTVHHRLKGPSYEAGTRLQAAAGLHHLIGNHWHVLVRMLSSLADLYVMLVCNTGGNTGQKL